MLRGWLDLNSLGPMSLSRELSLSGPWAWYHGAHLLWQATEEVKRSTASAASPTLHPLPFFPGFLCYGQAMADAPTPDDKTPFRRNAKAHRAVLASSAGGDAPERLKEAFMAARGGFALALGAVVAAYWPMEDEADPRALMTALADAGFRIALPVVTGAARPLVFRRWEPGAVLVPGRFGTQEPDEAADVLVPALVLVPLLAFDDAGWRIGYGGGFYDRTLEALRGSGSVTAIGVAFAGQQTASVPHGEHDQPLDGIITEAGFIKTPVGA